MWNQWISNSVHRHCHHCLRWNILWNRFLIQFGCLSLSLIRSIILVAVHYTVVAGPNFHDYHLSYLRSWIKLIEMKEIWHTFWGNSVFFLDQSIFLGAVVLVLCNITMIYFGVVDGYHNWLFIPHFYLRVYINIPSIFLSFLVI